MKYQSIEAFEKHLKQSYPHHLAKAYLITSSVEYDRKMLMEMVVQLFIQRSSTIGKERFNLQENALTEVLACLDTQDLFSTETCYIVDCLDKAKAADLEKLAHAVSHPAPANLLVLGAPSSKGLSHFYSQVKNDLIVLDLSEEKPWERQKRISDWIILKSAKFQKRITVDTANFLMEQVGADMALLEQEVYKLVCFIGEKDTIDQNDVKAISGSRDLITSWQLAETLIWQDKEIESELTTDLSALIPLLGQVRYHLEIGFQLAWMHEKKVPPNQIGPHFPNLRPNQLEKYASVARQRGAQFFKNALELLFDLEVKLKSSNLDPKALWDIFYSKITLIKMYDYV